MFTGFDGYKKVIDACDVVLLTTTPHFRPMHMKAAVEAGKHCFAEKPVAIDAPGVRSVIETAKKAKEKNLSLLDRLLLSLRVLQARDGQAHPRRRDRRRVGHPLQLHHARPGPLLPDEGADGDVGVPDAQLVLLHLDLRRPHRRAALPQPRQGGVGAQGRVPDARLRSRRTAVADRPEARQHLRPPHGRLRIQERRRSAFRSAGK